MSVDSIDSVMTRLHLESRLPSSVLALTLLLNRLPTKPPSVTLSQNHPPLTLQDENWLPSIRPQAGPGRGEHT